MHPYNIIIKFIFEYFKKKKLKFIFEHEPLLLEYLQANTCKCVSKKIYTYLIQKALVFSCCSIYD